MTHRSTRRRAVPAHEEGYILVAVIFMLALLIISMAVAVPKVRENIQRDHEVETMERGRQYTRAIQLYYRKFHAYPPNVDALVKTNEIRFLRKRYTDPITGKNDWKPIMFGQNKTPLALGFFGQPLGGSTLAGTGPGGIAGASPIGSSAAGSSGTGSSGSAFSSGSSLSSSGSVFGSSSTSPATGTTPTSSGTTGTPGATDSNFGSNQSFGGGGIIGFSPGVERASILLYKKKDHYNEWEFLYSPLQDQKMMQGGNTGTIGSPVGGNLFPSGSGSGAGSGSGSGSSFGSGTSAPTEPTSPTPQP